MTTIKREKNYWNVHNWLKEKISIRPGSWKFFSMMFKVLALSGPCFKWPLLGTLLKKTVMFSPRENRHSQSFVLNLNKDITDLSKNVVLPIDIMKKLIRESGYRIIMNKCICREGQGCSNYPHDFACIFLGEGVRRLAMNGLAREATIDEALTHIDRGAALGLVGQCLWIEVEQYIWGIKDENINKFLEVCFCCPCCCSALKFAKNTSIDIQSRFQSIGWKSSINKLCDGCGICEPICMINAISIKGERAIVEEEKCLGCGICASRCPLSAIQLTLKSPLKDDMKDYFLDKGLHLDI